MSLIISGEALNGTGVVSTSGVSTSSIVLDENGNIPASYVNYTGQTFLGLWDASTNTPTIANGEGTSGEYYLVKIAGNTTVDGNSIWQVGDYVIFDGIKWNRLDNPDSVVSVNTKTGNVVINATDLADFHIAVSQNTDVVSNKNKTQKLDVNGNITNQITTSVTSFTNDQELVSKKYIDDKNILQDSNISTLQNKTQKLDETGNIIAPITTSITSFTNDQEFVSKIYIDNFVNALASSTDTLQLKTQKLDTTGNITNQITTSVTSFTNDQELVSKKYVDDANNLQNSSVASLESKLLDKTQNLDENGNITNPITTSITSFTNDQEIVSKKYIDDVNTIQDGKITTLETKTQYITADTKTNIPILNSTDIETTNIKNQDLTPIDAINIGSGTTANISLKGSVYADLNDNRITTIDGTGLIFKTNAICNPNGSIECKDIDTKEIKTTTNNTNLKLTGLSGKGIEIKSDDANICFTGSGYAGNGPNTKEGKILQIDDAKGTLIAVDKPTGDVVSNTISSIANQIPTFVDTSGKLITNSNLNYEPISKLLSGTNSIYTNDIRRDAGVGGVSFNTDNSISLTGSNYQNQAGKYLLVNDNNGKIGIGNGGVTSIGPNNFDNEVVLYSGTDGQRIKKSYLAFDPVSLLLTGPATIYTASIQNNGGGISFNNDFSISLRDPQYHQAGKYLQVDSTGKIGLGVGGGGVQGITSTNNDIYFTGDQYKQLGGSEGTLRIDANGKIFVQFDAPPGYVPNLGLAGITLGNSTITASSILTANDDASKAFDKTDLYWVSAVGYSTETGFYTGQTRVFSSTGGQSNGEFLKVQPLGYNSPPYINRLSVRYHDSVFAPQDFRLWGSNHGDYNQAWDLILNVGGIAWLTDINNPETKIYTIDPPVNYYYFKWQVTRTIKPTPEGHGAAAGVMELNMYYQ